MRRRTPASASNRVIPAATAAGSSGSTRIPVSPSRTASGTPPERPPTTARPQADASTIEIPKPSEEIIAARGADIEVGRVVQRRQLVVPDEAEKPHRVAYPERRRQPLELRPTRADARHDVPDRRNGGAHGGQRPDHRIDPLVDVDPRHREEPRPALRPRVEAILLSHGARV